MSREAMKLALELIEPIAHNSTDDPRGKAYEAITALRQALETKQEPVAWRYKYPDGFWRFSNGERVNGSDSIKSQALYTSPPKREWVGLTDEEVVGIGNASGLKAKPTSTGIIIHPDGIKNFFQAIEAKLREKNHG